MMSKNKFFGSMSGKGYYIALILCAAAIGISGYMYHRDASKTKVPAPVTVPETRQDVPAVATKPQLEKPAEQLGTEPEKPERVLKTAVPVSGETVTEYAMDELLYNETTRDWRVHNGVDIRAEAGTAVTAAADGTVYTVYEDEAMGMTVVLRHPDGYTTKYASLAKEVAVKPGDKVTLGQKLGTVGDTALMETALGHHLHFSVSCNGKSVDPKDFLSLS